MTDLERRQQHYQFSQGRPRAHVFQTLRSDEVPARHRYAYWRDSVIYNVQLDRPDARQQQNFQASVTSLATRTGEMHYVVADRYGGQRSARQVRADQAEELALLYVLDGQISLDDARAGAMVARRGEFVLFDAAHPSRIWFEPHRMIQLDLPRARLQSAFAGRMPLSQDIGAALARSPLTPLLRQHLNQFPAIVHRLNGAERLALLDASEALAVSVLAGALAGAQPDQDYHRAGIFAASQRYIHTHLASPALNGERIAMAVGCSRASLYRLFAGHGLTVAGYIREERLQRFKRLLQSAPQRIPIQDLAMQCGLHDAPNVSRQFRARFGCTPRDIREAAQDLLPDGAADLSRAHRCDTP